MTTYTSAPQPPSPNGGPSEPHPLHADGRRTQLRPQRPGIITATIAFVLSAAAAAATAAALASPLTPAQHTVAVAVPPPAEYSSAEIQAAKIMACEAWNQAARALAQAGKTRAAFADSTGGSSPETRNARTAEKLVGTSQIAHLRSQIGDATPPNVGPLIQAWIGAQINSFHATNIRDWDSSNSARDRGNDLVDVIAPACGLR